MTTIDGQDQEGPEIDGENGRRQDAHSSALFSWPVVAGLGALIEIGLLAMVFFPPRPGATALFLTLFLATFACFAVIVWIILRPEAPRAIHPGRRTVLILLFAALFRMTMLPVAPALSGDVYRYLWDGRVVLAGHNPYSEPPSAAGLVALRDGLYDRLEHREVRTIYPPVAQALFALAVASGGGVTGLKVLLVLVDLLAIVLLQRLLVLLRLPPRRVLLYAWNPLVVIEVAWSGHLEPAGVACMLLAAGAIIQKRDVVSSLALTLATLVKLLPVALFAPFLRSIRARCLILPPLLMGLACWPFRSAGTHLVSGLREYAGRWVGNESIFGLLYSAIEWLDPTPALKSLITLARSRFPESGLFTALYGFVYPETLTRTVCAALVAVVAITLHLKRVEPLRGAFILIGTILLLSPTLHPWYLLWILPWVCLFPSWPWILLSGLVALSYANLGSPGRTGEPYPWVRWVEYGPFYALLVVQALRNGRAGLRLRDPSPAGPPPGGSAGRSSG